MFLLLLFSALVLSITPGMIHEVAVADLYTPGSGSSYYQTGPQPLTVQMRDVSSAAFDFTTREGFLAGRGTIEQAADNWYGPGLPSVTRVRHTPHTHTHAQLDLDTWLPADGGGARDCRETPLPVSFTAPATDVFKPCQKGSMLTAGGATATVGYDAVNRVQGLQGLTTVGNAGVMCSGLAGVNTVGPQDDYNNLQIAANVYYLEYDVKKWTPGDVWVDDPLAHQTQVWYGARLWVDKGSSVAGGWTMACQPLYNETDGSWTVLIQEQTNAAQTDAILYFLLPVNTQPPNQDFPSRDGTTDYCYCPLSPADCGDVRPVGCVDILPIATATTTAFSVKQNPFDDIVVFGTKGGTDTYDPHTGILTTDAWQLGAAAMEFTAIHPLPNG